MDTFAPAELLPATERPVRWRRAAFWRRALIIVMCALQTIAAGYALLGVLPYGGRIWLERALVAVFCVLFAFLSSGLWVGVYGFVVRRLGGDPLRPNARVPMQDGVPAARTAIVFPIFHEEVERTFAGVRATGRELMRAGVAQGFELFVLSDSRDPEKWLREREAWQALRLEEGLPEIHYRRRPLNLNRKTGNIGDFLRRWGRRYRYMVVMDADSLMGGPTLARLVQLMEALPRIGILQTSPKIVNATSTHARLQQFASSLYGPLFTEGLAALQLGEATFWGHNAILRVEPFMKNCGLPRLTGKCFLGGSVLSHDFVEAAYMRRAGYEVWLDPSLDGSYEETPPTMSDELARDRRWAHGNLQHLSFLFRRGMGFAYRLAFANGIMAYLSSALWFTWLVLTTAELARFVLFPIEYFPEPHNPYPVWPRWQPAWALRLALSTLFLLFMPKLLALLDLAFDRARAKAMGGVGRAAQGAFIESAFSVLLAPVRMLSHTWSVVTTLFNLEVRWAGQNRSQEYGWHQALLRYLPGSLLALAWSLFALWLQPGFFFWTVPVAVPLFIAGPVSLWLSRFRVGRQWRDRGWLCTPEERSPPEVLKDASWVPPPGAAELSAFSAAVLHPKTNRLHVALARRRRDTPARVARRESLVERCFQEGPGALTQKEKVWLLEDAQGLTALHRRVWLCDARSVWAPLLDSLCG